MGAIEQKSPNWLFAFKRTGPTQSSERSLCFNGVPRLEGAIARFFFALFSLVEN